MTDRAHTDTASHTVRTNIALALNTQENGGAPDWAQILPAGRVIRGRDGRGFVNDNTDQIIEAFKRDGGTLLLDWGHGSDFIAGDSRAAGWIEELENRDGALWGRVAWTDDGRESVSKRYYRFISPVIKHERATNKILSIVAVALVNRPNLKMQSLNHQQTQLQEDQSMTLTPAITKALNLADDATEQDAVTAITELKTAKAANAASPSLDTHVPRADYDAAVAKATNAQEQLDALHTAQREAEIDTAIALALDAGKITPATKDYHREQCRTEGGLARFKAFTDAAPVIGGDSGLDDKTPHTATALNHEETAVAKAMGMSADDFNAAKQDDKETT